MKYFSLMAVKAAQLRDRKPSLIDSARRDIVRALASNRFEIGKPLPTHRAWAAELGVSAFIVRMAMNSLRQYGLIEARQGSHTYLLRRPNDQEVQSICRGGDPITIHLSMVRPRDIRRVQQTAIRKEFQRRFEAENPGVRFDERLEDLDVSEVEAAIVNNWMAGSGPSIALARRTYSSFLIEHGLIQPMAGESIGQFAKLIHPKIVEACRWPGSNTDDGEQMLIMPVSYSLSFLVYHKAAFVECGLNPAQPPADWDQLVVALSKLAKWSGEPSLWFPSWDAAAWWLFQCIHDARQPADDPGDLTLPAINWSSPEAKLGVAMFHRVFAQEKLAAVYEGPATVHASRWMSGRATMGFGTEAATTVCSRPEEFGLCPTPAGPSGRSVCQLNVVGWQASTNMDAATLDAAERYLGELQRWIHLEDGGQRLMRAGVAPRVVSWLAEPDNDHYVAPNLPDSWRQLFASLLECSRLEPQGSDVEKLTISEALRELFGSGERFTAEHLLDHCRIAVRGQAMPGLTSHATAS